MDDLEIEGAWRKHLWIVGCLPEAGEVSALAGSASLIAMADQADR